MVRRGAWPPAELKARSERKTLQIGSQEGTGMVCMDDQNRTASHVDHEIKNGRGLLEGTRKTDSGRWDFQDFLLDPASHSLPSPSAGPG